ncbi:MAG: hypothetical protein AB7O97_23360 [Planctomycetota bacterium]
MSQPPTADAVRALIRPLDDLDRKVLGGLIALMIAEPGKIRDQEWLAQSFVQVSVVALGVAEDAESADATATDADVERVQQYATARMPDLVLAAASLFVRTAEDLREGDGPATMEAAREIVQGYLAT